MSLTLAKHPVDGLTAAGSTGLHGSSLHVNLDELRLHLLEDRRLESVDLEIVNPGDSCRAGYVYDILELRAKAPGSGNDFPGILGPISTAGQGTTHVLTGAVVTVLDGGQPGGDHGFVTRRGGMTKILEMSGPASGASPYASKSHLVVTPHAHSEVPRKRRLKRPPDSFAEGHGLFGPDRNRSAPFVHGSSGPCMTVTMMAAGGSQELPTSARCMAISTARPPTNTSFTEPTRGGCYPCRCTPTSGWTARS